MPTPAYRLPYFVEQRKRKDEIIDELRLSVACSFCGAKKDQECKPEYGCDSITRAEEALVEYGISRI